MLAWEYGKVLAPHRGGFKSLYDALQLSNCAVPNPPVDHDAWGPPTLTPVPSDHVVIYVDADHGSDDRVTTTSGTSSSSSSLFSELDAPGQSPDAPLHSLEAAVRASRAIVAATRPGEVVPPRHIVLIGKHYVSETIQLTPADSGLHIRNGGVCDDGPTSACDVTPGELTGAKRLTGLVWERYTPKPPKPAPPVRASFLANENNVFGVAKAGKDSPGIK